MTYALFSKAANRYDWHTPPHHYQDDHAFVLSQLPASGRILDIGCGTGVFLEKALAAGLDATGLDNAPEMVAIASRRVGDNRVKVVRMQDISETETYDGIVSLSWSFNYVSSFREANEVLNCFFNILRPGGRLILQIAHAPNASGVLNEDREPGVEGQLDDIIFLYRFYPSGENSEELRAQYVYGCKSHKELLFEEHHLNAADAHKVAAEATAVGFQNVELLDSWKGAPLDKSINAFLLAIRP